MILLFEHLRGAATSLTANKVRSFLTTLGIVIGVSSIVLLIGLGEGVKRDITAQVQTLGTNAVFVLPGKIETGQGFNPAASLGANTLSETDLESLRQIESVEAVVPLTLLSGTATLDGRDTSGAIAIGTTPQALSLLNREPGAGAFFTDQDFADRARVIYLEYAPFRSLFPTESPTSAVGRTVTFANESFTIVGVGEPSSGGASVLSGQGFESMVYLPRSTANELFETSQIFRILLRSRDLESVDRTVQEAHERLSVNHRGTEDFTIFTQDDLLAIIDDIIALLTNAITGIAAISLLVGGIGIMNIMLVSVTERTREVGIRKALGASNRDIFTQFLVEAVILSLLGGLLGTLLAIASAQVIEAKAGLSIVVGLKPLLLAFGFSSLVGIVFGVAPAVRAARLNPIDALRYE